MRCIIFLITVRLLQNNERGFPLIFTITVVEYITQVKGASHDHEYIHLVILQMRLDNPRSCVTAGVEW
jgi:hypothetical protein